MSGKKTLFVLAVQYFVGKSCFSLLSTTFDTVLLVRYLRLLVLCIFLFMRLFPEGRENIYTCCILWRFLTFLFLFCVCVLIIL